MTELDIEYIEQSITLGHVVSNALEVGTAEDWCSLKPLLESKGIFTTGIDIKPGKYVDYIVDLEESSEKIKEKLKSHCPFQSILCLNVLEHTFNPGIILDNLLGLLAPNGYLIISTPLVWPLHSYPFDFWRPLPNFYEQYAKRNGLTLFRERFKYLGFGLVSDYTSNFGSSGLPSPKTCKYRFLWGRLIHKVFNTFGQEYLFPNHLALALTYQRN